MYKKTVPVGHGHAPKRTGPCGTNRIKKELRKMKVSKEELLHIANLSMLEIKEDEIDNYLLNLQDILNFANTI